MESGSDRRLKTQRVKNAHVWMALVVLSVVMWFLGGQLEMAVATGELMMVSTLPLALWHQVIDSEQAPLKLVPSQHLLQAHPRCPETSCHPRPGRILAQHLHSSSF